MDALYTDALERLARFQARDHDGVSALGRTMALLHGRRTPRAAVLFHGLSASPAQFVQVANGLFDEGYNVVVPRLPHHGHADRMTDALAKLTSEDLKEIARESLAIAGGLGEAVTVSGFSLGGLLAAWLAQTEPLERAVAVAPFLGIAWVPNRWSGKIADVALRLPNAFGWWDPLARQRQMPEHGYPRYSTHALAQAYLLAREVLDTARETPPLARRIAIVTNAREAAINNRSARKLITRWRATRADDVETYEFSDLPLSHDIIEPLRHPRIVERVYPVLMRLLLAAPSGPA